MILITRPKEQSTYLQGSLDLLGCKTIQENLYKITYFKEKIKYKKSNYYIFPSIHSVKSLIKSNQIHKFRDANILVIGKKTKKALEDSGCNKILLFFENSDGLIKIFNKKKYKSNNYIYLCSNIINDDFIYNIKKIDINLKQKILYKTNPRLNFTKKTLDSFKLKKITGVIFYSNLGAKTFLSLIDKNKIKNSVKEINIFCISERVARIFKLNKFKAIFVAVKPNEQSLIAKIANKYSIK